MGDILTISREEKDPKRIADVARQLSERFPAAEALATTSVQPARTITAGTGLTGGGDLSANRTLAIATDGVTNTLLANMATKTYKGRTSASTGDPEDVAASTVRADVDAEQIGVVAGINTQTGNYTAVLSDKGKFVEMNVAGANTFTIPANANVAFDIGTYITIYQRGTGQTTIAPDTGVSVAGYNSAFKLTGQHAVATIIKRDTNAWVASGNLTP